MNRAYAYNVQLAMCSFLYKVFSLKGVYFVVNRKVVSISMDEEEYELFKKSKKYISEQFLEQEISNSKFLKYILSDFYYELNEMKNTNAELE